MKTTKEKNKIHLLEILSLGDFNDKLKFHKLVFELQARYHLFDYSWVRADYGPFSKELDEDICFLVTSNQIKENNSGYSQSQIKINNMNEDILSYISKLKVQTRKSVLHNIYNNYDIYQYELGDIIRVSKRT